MKYDLGLYVCKKTFVKGKFVYAQNFLVSRPVCAHMRTAYREPGNN